MYEYYISKQIISICNMYVKSCKIDRYDPKSILKNPLI